MVKLLGSYKNGTYDVRIYDDGTKIRETDGDDFIPDFAESCDCKITSRCDGGCAWCYEGCSPEGEHGDIMNYPFLETLHPYTEMALNGNDLTHPDLIPFLEKLKEKKVIANMTVNQIHFEKHQDLIRDLVDKQLIYGLGISLREATNEFVKLVKQYPNAVIHVINGILTKDDIDILQNNDLKMLILGYKELGRGTTYLSHNIDRISFYQMWLYQNIIRLFSKFKAISFDNLALKQLNVKRFLTDDEWNEFYMGDDAEYTFYIDMVDGTYSKSSLTSDSERFPILDSIDDMFEKVRCA